MVVIECLEKHHLSSGREQEFVSVQSFKKQKEGSSTGLCTDRAVRRVRPLAQHGSSARTVSVLLAQHGSSARGVSKGHVR